MLADLSYLGSIWNTNTLSIIQICYLECIRNEFKREKDYQSKFIIFLQGLNYYMYLLI